MKLIIDMSGNYSGGCLQVALSFLYECAKLDDKDIEYHVFLGVLAQEQVDKDKFGKNFNFYDIPLISILRRNRYLRNIEKDISPDVAFSIFSPSYYRSDCSKVQGFAQGHYIYDDSPYWKICGLKEKLFYKLKKTIHLWLTYKEADCIITETKDATTRISKILGMQKEYYTVSNTCNSFFRDFVNTNTIKLLPIRTNKEKRLLTLCTYHTHKNLIIIPRVIDCLLNKGYNFFKFVVTIDELNYNRIIQDKYREFVINLGRIDMADAPQLYSEIDFMFSPTLLECFSANYPEAMIMEKPILTSDLPFATTICKEAALYFNPCNAEDIANKIIELYNDKRLQQQLVDYAKQRLKDFLTPKQRAEEYIRICKLTINKHKNQ